MKNKLKRVNAALLATIMLGSFSLKKANAEPNNNRIEKYTLTEEEYNNENYSYLINDEEENLLSADEVKTYNRIINAIMNREESIILTEEYDRVYDIVYAVVYSQYYAYVDSFEYYDEDHELRINYAFTKEEQDQKIEFIQTEMNKIFDELFVEGMSIKDKMILLYQYCVKNFRYAMVSSLKKGIYLDTLLENKTGVCHSYAYFFDYFCQVNGIPSYQLLGYFGKTYHMWNMIQLDDGHFYMFDATMAITQVQGRMLFNTFYCFGLTKSEYKSGYSMPKDVRIKSVKIKVRTIPNLRGYYTAEYVGYHIFKLYNYQGTKFTYYNSETDQISDNIEDLYEKGLIK